MDIVAKHTAPDPDGVRIASLNEESFRYLLWDHQPLTDFWQIGTGTVRKLRKHGIHTMGELARASLTQEEMLFKEFGIDAEILIDHAWGSSHAGWKILNPTVRQTKVSVRDRYSPALIHMKRPALIVQGDD